MLIPQLKQIALATSVTLLCVPAVVVGQTNPAPQPVPASQNWGGMPFASLPSGFAAWNGLSGVDITTQALAEASIPMGDATLFSLPPQSGGAGGCYGYAVASDARFAVLTSNDGTNGANQLALSVNTTGSANLEIQYDMINAVSNPRSVGVVCQYRIGNNGLWTTLQGWGNPYVQSYGQVGTIQHTRLRIPQVAEEQANVQIRWAVWRGSEGGPSAAVAIDNILVQTIPEGPSYCVPRLIPRDINAGGVLVASAGSYQLEASIGGIADVQDLVGGPYTIQLGFWQIERVVVPLGISIDIDGDFDSDSDDLNTFIAVLLGVDLNSLHFASSDLNCDGDRDARDIRIFVDTWMAM